MLKASGEELTDRQFRLSGPFSRSDPPRALLLTAGLGTRLRPLTDVRAKAAVPVNGVPLVLRILSWLASHGISDVVLNLHHRPETIAAVVGDGAEAGVRVRYSWEQPILGSAGGPRHALPLLMEGGDAPFLIVNGDTLTTVDLAAMMAAHTAAGAAVTLALIANPRPDQYGGVQLTNTRHVTGFTRPGLAPDSFHFTGVQIVEPRALADLEDGVAAESVNMLYPRLIAGDARAVFGFVSDADFIDIGTPRDYLATSHALAAIEGDRLAHGKRVDIARSAELVGTTLWDDVVVGAGARLTNCILGDGVRVADQAVFEGSSLIRLPQRPLADDEQRVGDLLVRRIHAA